MNRRDFLTAAALGAGAAALSPCLRALGAEAGPRRRPNIVLIFIDDMGYADPSCFGNPMVKTPTMDRLAAEGIKLTNFYVNSPICSPSRVAVTTGMYPGRWGINGHFASRAVNRRRHMPDWLDPKAPTDGRLLKAAGYATAHFGKWHMGGGRDVGDAPLPQAYGFEESLVSFEGLGDRILPPGGLSKASARLGRGEIRHVPKHEQTRIYVDRAIDFIRRHKDEPFYLRLWPNDVHDGHQPAPGAAEQFAEVTQDPAWQRFFAVLVEMDRQLGRLIEAIDRLGLAEDTLIVLTSDNGPTDWPHYYKDPDRVHPPGFTGPFFGRKWSLYEGGIRMPCIARWKGRIPAGTTNDTSITAGIDLLPTFCAIAGVPVPDKHGLDGVDMSAALLGKPVRRAKPVFWQYGDVFSHLRPGNKDYVSPSLAVRDGRWKLLMNPDGSDTRLFDLEQDPGEKTSLAGKHPQVVERMKEQLLAWYRDVGYPQRLATNGSQEHS